ncbi:MAG: hypothetical protein JWP25_4685 [Bradyrhizobium sp.]|nr:hypothetical protein [Bradyrhizobium sp.]
MLGFDALGSLALGQIPGATVVAQPLTTRIGAMSRSRSNMSPSFAATARIGSQSKVSANWSGLFAASGRIGAQSTARVPGGIVLKTIINGQAKATATAGILISARISQWAYVSADIHIQGTLSTTRKALLLDGSAPITASYWKGNA